MVALICQAQNFIVHILHRQVLWFARCFKTPDDLRRHFGFVCQIFHDVSLETLFS